MNVTSKSIGVNAPEDEILGIIRIVEDSPSWQNRVQKIEDIAKDDQDRPTQARMHVWADSGSVRVIASTTSPTATDRTDMLTSIKTKAEQA